MRENPSNGLQGNQGEWVDIERGLVSRETFTSDDIYRQELTRIFDRTWICLGHNSEIPEPGDYMLRRLGSAPVIVARARDKSCLLYTSDAADE